MFLDLDDTTAIGEETIGEVENSKKEKGTFFMFMEAGNSFYFPFLMPENKVFL